MTEVSVTPDASARARTVLMGIPAQQYADQLAAALAEGGMLDAYYCGTPPRPEVRETIGDRFHLSPLQRTGHAVARKLFGRTRLWERFPYFFYRSFGRKMARKVRRTRADAIIGYENAALHAFEAAKRRGILTILDAADVHHRLKTEHGDVARNPDLQRSVTAGKDRELELADYVLCCSELAKQTYVDAGFARDRIYVAPLGASIRQFAGVPRPSHAGEPLRLFFAGRFSVKKGADVLAEALERLRDDGLAFSLQVAATTSIGNPALIRRFESLGTLLGQVPQPKLPALMADSDLLVLPSRMDSYGMVVAEAMAAGTPALVTTNVGAKDLIVPGENGFIVPPADVDALYTQLRWCIENPEAVRAMSVAAASAGATADWSRYRAQVRANIEAIFDRHWPA